MSLVLVVQLSLVSESSWKEFGYGIDQFVRVTLVMTFIVILLGAYTDWRMQGLGPDWPGAMAI